MPAQRDVNAQVGEVASVARAGENTRPVPVSLARRGDAALSSMVSRVVSDDGLSRLDVAAFQSSI